MVSTDYKIDPELIDDLLYSARHADAEFLQETIDALVKANPDVPVHKLVTAAVDSESGNTAFHMAAANGHVEILKSLLSHYPHTVKDNNTSPANYQNESGNTPLHYAAINGHLEACKLFFEEWDGDLGLKNKAGKGPYTEAEGAERENIVDWGLTVWAGIAEFGDDGDDQEGEAGSSKIDEQRELDEVKEAVESLKIEEEKKSDS